MINQCAKRLLVGLMCVSLIFQSGSVTSFAAEQTVQEDVLKNMESTAEQELLTEHGMLIQGGG